MKLSVSKEARARRDFPKVRSIGKLAGVAGGRGPLIHESALCSDKGVYIGFPCELPLKL